MSTTLTLVERLKAIDEEAMYHMPASTHATIAEAISLLEAAEKALEPFAKHYFSPAFHDDETVAEFWRIGDLRLARTVINMLKGNDHEG